MAESGQALRRSKRTIIPISRYKEGNFFSLVSCFFAGPLDEREPARFEDDVGVKEWDSAMNEEMKALEKK